MKKVSKYFIKYLIRKHRTMIPYEAEELDKYFCKNKTRYIACDNSTGDCLVEDFKHIRAVHDFLNTNKPLEEIKREDKLMGYNKEDD